MAAPSCREEEGGGEQVLLARKECLPRPPTSSPGWSRDGVERGDLKPKSGGTLRELSCLEVTKKNNEKQREKKETKENKERQSETK